MIVTISDIGSARVRLCVAQSRLWVAAPEYNGSCFSVPSAATSELPVMYGDSTLAVCSYVSTQGLQHLLHA